MSPEFLFTATLVCLAPGIGVVYTLSVALGSGLRAGLWAALGCTLASVAHLSLAIAGLAAVLHTSALLFMAIKYAGVAYMLWMAWGALRGEGALAVQADRRAVPPARLVWRGVALNILNPKLPMFFMAFLPQFIAADRGDATAALVELGLVFCLITGVVMAGYALAAGQLRVWVVESERAMRWIRRLLAASFAGLGLRLAMERA